MQRKALGKGLSALIPDSKLIADSRQQSVISEIEIERIAPNRYQPRTFFDEEEISRLASSIRSKGIIQPLMVRRSSDGWFELIAGERRLKAARLAGYKRVPVIIREADDEEMVELTLIENLQREDLNPIEEAKAYQRLINEFKLTQDKVSEKVGKDRSTIANSLRLLSLPFEIQEELKTGRISVGHAKVILSIHDETGRLRLFQRIIKDGLSVRETESMIKHGSVRRRRLDAKRDGGGGIDDLEERLKRHLGTNIKVAGNASKGRIIIEFYSKEDLQRIIDMILR